MDVKLLAMSNSIESDFDTEDILLTSLSQCYNESFDLYDTKDMPQEKKDKIVKAVLASGHTSVAEHISFTFLIENVSRVTTHQIVRHRAGMSYSQRSGRYTGLEDGYWYVVPPTINTKEKLDVYTDWMNYSKNAYDKLCEMGVPKEDARYGLPNGQYTNIAVTANCRALQNFFGLRLCTRAQWEIRNMAKRMADICREKLPIVFVDAKFAEPKCKQIGFCVESKCCGLMPSIKSLGSK